MIVLSPDQLKRFCKELFIRASASEKNAEVVANHLLLSNLKGHDSHGISCSGMYVESIRQGYLKPSANPSVIADTGSAAVVSGGWTFGQVGVEFATRIAVEKAKKHGVAMVGAIHCDHTGRMGHYSELAASEGIGTFISVAGFEDKFMVPPGGSEGALAANPLAFGFPAGKYPPVIVDFATTAVAVGKLAIARDEGNKVGPGLILDKAGGPTIDPNDFFDDGALLPFGGHKGYGLALVVEILGGAMIGKHVAKDPGNPSSGMANTGTLIIAFDTSAFQSNDSYNQAVEGIVERMKKVKPSAGSSGVMVPGEPELAARERRLKDGIEIADATWARIRRAADASSIEMPQV